MFETTWGWVKDRIKIVWVNYTLKVFMLLLLFSVWLLIKWLHKKVNLPAGGGKCPRSIRSNGWMKYTALFMNGTLRVYSHLSCLVRFPLWCGSFGQVWIQQSHSGAHQTTEPRPSWRGGLGSVPNELWSGPFKVWIWTASIRPNCREHRAFLCAQFF